MKNQNHINLNPYPLKLYGTENGTHQDLAKKVAKLLKNKLSTCIYKVFGNGEFLIHHSESIRDRDVYIISQPRFGSKEQLSYDLDECESLVFSLKQGEPSRITVIMPCLPYTRQDKASNHREPVLSQKIPMRLQTAGADRLVVLKMHNPSSFNAHPHTIPMVDVDTIDLIAKHICAKHFDLKKFKIIAPDLGAAPFARKLAGKLGIPGKIVIVNKFRDPKKLNHAETLEVIGDPNGFDCIIPDDIADTCGTAIKCFKVLKEKGARNIYFTATHAILSKDAIENLNSVKFSGVWFADTCLSLEKSPKIKNLEIISTAKLIAQIIDNLHNGNSVTELWHNAK